MCEGDAELPPPTSQDLCLPQSVCAFARFLCAYALIVMKLCGGRLCACREKYIKGHTKAAGESQ